jgi:putative FmdB family regulatory protein
MPLFEYHCRGCGQDFEKIEKLGNSELVVCPACGSGETTKKISAFSEVKKTSKPCFSGG